MQSTKMKRSFHYLTVLLVVSLGFQSLSAQDRGDSLQQQQIDVYNTDSLQRQTIDIYNTYKPTLRQASKINLNPSLPKRDESSPALIYNIPSQNLYFSYSPIPLQPLAVGIDTALNKGYDNYLKLGIGNKRTPLAQLGLNKTIEDRFQLGLRADHLSSKGSLEQQQFSKTKIEAQGKYFSRQHVFHAKVGYGRHGVRYFEDIHSPGENLKQAFNTVSLNLGLQNKVENSLGVNYQPELTMSNFFDGYKRSESSVRIKVPVEKEVVKNIFVKAEVLGDFSRYKDKMTNTDYSNNLFSVHPAVVVSMPQFMLNAGLNPTWSRGEFFLLPDIVNETHLLENSLILSSGWISHFKKNSFENLANENPYIKGLADFPNLRIDERYTGFKGSIGDRFSYNTKFSFTTFHDAVLFVNDVSNGLGGLERINKFDLIDEEELKAYEFHAEVGYTIGDRMSAQLGMSFFNFTGQKEEEKPWGMRPFTSTLSLQYRPVEKLKVGADLYVMSGSFYRAADSSAMKTNGVFDLNLNGSFDISERFGVFLDVNNLLNRSYQRWNGYPSIGLNIIGGILFKF